MKSVGKFLKSQAILCLLALFIVFLAISRPSFVSPTNIKNVLMDASIYGVAAMAMTIAIITGAFDLSLSANFAWAQIFFCFLLNTWGDTAGGILLAFVCTLLSTMAIGAINGLVIVKGDIPAFIATMGMSYMIKGGCLVFTGGDMIATSNTFIAELGKDTFLGQSYLTYIFILVAVVCHLFMKYTQAGRNFYATGGNIVSAKLSGIKVNAYRFATFVILGLAAGLAGCMYVCEIRAGSVLYGTDLSLTCIAATVVGGTSLSGGRGGVHRTVIGILLLYVMYKGLGFLGLGGYMNTMVKGIVLLLVVSFDAFVTQSGTKKPDAAAHILISHTQLHLMEEFKMTRKEIAQKLLQEGEGILRLTPTWVPRSFCRPGRRIKLHPDDYYALGLSRGGIDERWFASTTHAENGPGTPDDEGLSYVVSADDSEKMLLREMVSELGADVIGEFLWNKYHRWPAYSKFFDNLGPLPHHIHQRDEHAALTGQAGKPEMYFFPAQVNNYRGERAETYFGLNPGTTKEELKQSLMNFTKGDNKILELSRAYKQEVDTGYDVPAGVLHAPGTLCTYEPQFASDVFAMYQSVLWGDHCTPEELLWKDTPQDKLGDFDYLVDVVDWEKNVDPEFHKHRFMAPKPVRPMEEMQKEGYIEEWICYKCKLACAKRLTVLPGQTVTIRDGAPYGMIMLQGHGTMGKWDIETPTQIRFGQLTHDEYFVTADAAKKGVVITNTSKSDPIVMLKHFGENPDLVIEDED